ncbi:MAG TPA: hydroxymethylbilane synthase [Desulfosalsimonadaceae bacterium]|nr:hydroxymethylbilane synthase [Desulfosalsimonadaceae bacterium]
MKSPTIRIGTRGSQLALWQANWVKQALEALDPDLEAELCVIKTSGDKILDVPLAKVGGKGLFVKEIEQALMEGTIDLAVHSMKDMPGQTPEALCIGAIPERETPFDVLIAKEGRRFTELPRGAHIGTSSLRRASQVLHLRPDIQVHPLRGNLDTRIKKLETEALDAIILAGAGVRRLEMEHVISETLDPALILPAVGQGALCIEVRKDDAAIHQRIAPLEHEVSTRTVSAERAFLKRLEGGCQVPMAAYGQIRAGTLHLDGMVAETDGSVMHHRRVSGPVENAGALGQELADILIAMGADKILARLSEEGHL